MYTWDKNSKTLTAYKAVLKLTVLILSLKDACDNLHTVQLHFCLFSEKSCNLYYTKPAPNRF